ncbi:MAG: glycosyltransferase family 4 protein [Candidatus Eremiobacteraeota bacterium]|nr:glycosyltransferase family 4 protein [Candidatus Eremiobacteraeota bacterium]MBV9263072.1 glycosyltransferase family 4 protein [Candidatus Eremiobacteraeota bacterium]
MIRIGVDAWNLPGDRRGIGRYLREILRVWWERERNRVEVALIVPEWHTVTVRQRYLREVEWRHYRIVSRRYHRRARLDALWFPFNGCSWTDFALPATATLHDASNFVVANYAPATQEIFRAAASRCSALITVSEFSRRELSRELRIPESRFAVIPSGVGAPRPAVPVALDVLDLQPYVLYVGDAERRKGFDTLLQAMARVSKARADVSLVVTSEITGWNVPDDVRIVALGHVDDDTLAALYRSCAVLAFPSRYEGFGLPVLEAMSYGAPVVASDAAALREVGGTAACYVPVDAGDALADAILRVLCDAGYAADLRTRGFRRATMFSWEDAAKRTLEAIMGTIEAPK